MIRPTIILKTTSLLVQLGNTAGPSPEVILLLFHCCSKRCQIEKYSKGLAASNLGPDYYARRRPAGILLLRVYRGVIIPGLVFFEECQLGNEMERIGTHSIRASLPLLVVKGAKANTHCTSFLVHWSHG